MTNTPATTLGKELAYRAELLRKATGELLRLQEDLAVKELRITKDEPPSAVLVSILEHLGLIDPRHQSPLDIRQSRAYNSLQLFNDKALLNGFSWSNADKQYVNIQTGKRWSNAKVLERITQAPDSE